MKKITHISIELIADDGMLLTDGKHFCKAVFLPDNENSEDWKEIPEHDSYSNYN